MQTEKKPYSPPTITDHGDAVEETKGFCGELYEYQSNAPWVDHD